MRVVLLTQWFGARAEGVLTGIAQSLSERGAQVCVVAGDRASRSSQRRSKGSGTREHLRGMPVLRYPYFHSHDDSVMRRLLTYATFSASTLRAIPVLNSADVVLAYGSPATAAAAALIARKLGGAPYVLMVQDVWPDSVFATGFISGRLSTKLADCALGAYLSSVYANASQVTANSPSMRELLVSRGADPQRTHVVYNWSSVAEQSQPGTPERTSGQPLELMYAGNIGAGQDLGNVLTALSLVPRESVRLTVVGDGVEEESKRAEAERLGLTNVRFMGRVPMSELTDLMLEAHMHLVSLRDTKLFSVTIPSKFQALLAAGVPVLSVAEGEVKRMVQESGGGLASPPGDPQALADVIKQAIALDSHQLVRMGQASRKLYDLRMTEKQNADVLFRVIRSAASKGA